MIIAEIGHAKFLLKNIEAAESLLRILSEAKQISETYIGKGVDGKMIRHENPNETNIEVSVTGEQKILSYDEAMALKESAQENT